VSVINTAPHAVMATVMVGRNPVDVDGTRAYVTNAESNSVSVIDTRTRGKLLCLSTRKLPPREKQNGTYKGNQHPPCVCLRYYRDAIIPIAIATPLFVVVAITISIMIPVSIGERGKNQRGCD
jgi:hypothetical protein